MLVFDFDVCSKRVVWILFDCLEFWSVLNSVEFILRNRFIMYLYSKKRFKILYYVILYVFVMRKGVVKMWVGGVVC